MIVEQPGFWLAVLQIIWIDILLSGDNAVVIALACRKLPPQQRVWGVVLGTVVAISLRVVFAGLVTTLMQMAYLKLVGGVLLLWIAVKLLGPEENGKSGEVQAVDTLWRAIRIVAIADLVMSLDNVIAIAAVAERFEAPQSYALLMFGLAVSIPLIMAGAAIVMALLERFPVVVWAGAALLGWIAGEIIAKDPLFTANLDPDRGAHGVDHRRDLGRAVRGRRRAGAPTMAETKRAGSESRLRPRGCPSPHHAADYVACGLAFSGSAATALTGRLVPSAPPPRGRRRKRRARPSASARRAWCPWPSAIRAPR